MSYDNGSISTILDALRSHASSVRADTTAICFLKSDDERQTITFRQLDRQARRVASALLEHAEPGERALLTYPPGLEFIEAFLGCLYAGIVAVPAYPPKKNRNAERVLAIAHDCDPRLLLCTSATSGSWSLDFAAAIPNSKVVATNEISNSDGNGLPNVNASNLAFLQYTSGSTAAPKGVMITHGNIVANERIIQRHFAFDFDSTMVSWLPMFHDMGLIGGILAPLFVGFRSVLMASNEFLREPIKWLQTVSEFRGTCTGAPNFAYELCVRKINRLQKQRLDLSSLTIAYNGSEPIRAETLARFNAAFADCGFNPRAWFPCYGLAETTLLVSGGPPPAPTNIMVLDSQALVRHRVVETNQGQPVVGCGQVTADLDVRIVDPESCSPRETNEVGEVWVHGASVAQGYFQRPEETHATFHARLAGDTRDWLRTGDYGFLRDGELYITGRIKDLIIIRGRNIYPQDIEQLVEKHLELIELNGCAAFSVEVQGEEQLVIVVESSREVVRWANSDPSNCEGRKALAESIERLREAISEQLEVVPHDIVFVRPATFPRASSGKVQRRICRQLYLEQKLDEIAVERSPLNGDQEHRIRHPAFDKSSLRCENNLQDSIGRTDRAINWLRDFSQRRLNSFVADERRTIAPHVILGLGSNGFMGLQAPVAIGGLSLSNSDVLRVMEQLAAIDLSLASIVGVHNGLGLRPILNYATSALKDDVLPALASGRMLGSFALTEPGSGSNPLSMQSTAVPCGEGWKLSAHKQWIGLAQWAGAINVFARRLDEQGRAAGVIGITVPEDHPQLRNGPESLTMGLRAIVQNDVLIDNGYFESKYVLGVPGEGFTVAQDAMMFCRLGIAAEAIGVMKRCFQLMLNYATRRNISTGRLVDNPVTINRLEDTLLAVGALDSLAYGIADDLDRGTEVPIEAYATCKILAPELAWSTADRLVQCLGGRGYTETNVAPRILRDTRLLRIFEGPTETLQMYLGSRVSQSFESVRAWLIKTPAGAKLADRLLQDINELAAIAGPSIPERQWHFQQVGQLASWAMLAFYASKSCRPCSYTTSDIRQWIDARYELAKIDAQRERAFRRCTTTTASSLIRAGKMIADRIGSCVESLPAPCVTIDELVAEGTHSENSQSSDVANRSSASRSNASELATDDCPADAREDTRQLVRSVVRDWLQSEVNPDATSIEDGRQFGAMGMDSVGAVSLTVALEKAFSCKLPDGLLFQHQSINELVQYLERDVTQLDNVEIRLATTPEELEAVYRFRYAVYVEEMNRPQFYADHEQRRIVDPLDQHGDVFAVWQGNRVVGTVRINLLRQDSLDEYRKIYGISDPTEEELASSSISTRIMLSPHVRQSPVAAKLLAAAYAHGLSNGIQYDYCDCNNPVLDFFERIGYRAIRRVQHPEYGDVNVMRIDLTDTEYLQSVGSPLVLKSITSNNPDLEPIS